MAQSYRDLIWMRELKAMRDAEAKEIADREEAERIEKERPIKEAEAALQATANELAKTIRERIATQADDEVFVDPDTATLKMPWPEAHKFNREQIELFKSQNPQCYWSQANVDTIGDYFTRNKLQIISAKTLKAAWNRLSEYGLLETEPAPEPEPQPELTRRAVKTAKVDPEQVKQEAWDKYTLEIVATDPATGQTYTQYQLDRCSAEEYRRLMFGERYTPKISTVIYGKR